MATPAPQTQQTDPQAPPPLQLTPNDLQGALQRLCGELTGYLWAPPEQVNAHVVMAFLQRMAEFASYLPVPESAQNNGAPQSRKAS
jgi:hypothetical protein